MGYQQGERRELARIRLACGLMVGGTDAILEAYQFGVTEGPHPQPWTAEYHQDAVAVYSESLPPSYQRDVARLFHITATAMNQRMIRAELAEDWTIVAAYMHNAAASINTWFATHPSSVDWSGPVVSTSPAAEPASPRIVHWDHLAALTTHQGIHRLKAASVAVKHHFDADAPRSLDTTEVAVLERLSSGTAIADIAMQLGYSERSMYRELSKLWTKLGVSNRSEGLHKATTQGLIT